MNPLLTTPVAVKPLPFTIDFASGIVSLGSCFSDEIGTRLEKGGFHIERNPFGALYNPASIASGLRRIAEDREVGMADLVEYEGYWHSWHHHGRFSRPTAEETLAACNERIHQAHAALREASLLMVTFGSAWVFELVGCTEDVAEAETGGSPEADEDTAPRMPSFIPPADPHFVVANCHKLPARMFRRRRMTVEEIVALWQPLLQQVAALFPQLSFLFSVSPIRHLADGLHGNQLSKATLLLALDELLGTRHLAASVSYFPAYEIVLDELRDYRFFGADMTHPSTLAADIVWEHLQRATMKPAVRQQAAYNAKEAKRAQHIPIHPAVPLPDAPRQPS